MAQSNQEIIDKYFESYMKRDMNGVRQVMSENVEWSFPGQHPFAGVKKGIDEVIAFFDAMGETMKKSNPKIDKLIVASNDHYAIECAHIQTNRPDGINIDHHICVLWTFENGKIINGKHFFANPEAANKYFNAVASAR